MTTDLLVSWITLLAWAAAIGFLFWRNWKTEQRWKQAEARRSAQQKMQAFRQSGAERTEMLHLSELGKRDPAPQPKRTWSLTDDDAYTRGETK